MFNGDANALLRLQDLAGSMNYNMVLDEMVKTVLPESHNFAVRTALPATSWCKLSDGLPAHGQTVMYRGIPVTIKGDGVVQFGGRPRKGDFGGIRDHIQQPEFITPPGQQLPPVLPIVEEMLRR